MEWTSEHYNLIVSEEAKCDISLYVDYIIYECDAPKTAKKHYDELMALLKKIQQHPTAFPVRTNVSLFQYGYDVRRANYKKMAILYNIVGSTVYVCRMMAASMITDD
jgi:plasmid stabilization system protein ParE